MNPEIVLKIKIFYILLFIFNGINIKIVKIYLPYNTILTIGIRLNTFQARRLRRVLILKIISNGALNDAFILEQNKFCLTFITIIKKLITGYTIIFAKIAQ